LRNRLQALADLWRNARSELLLGTETLCNIESLLPALQLSLIVLLEQAILLEVLVIVVVIEIKLAHLEESSGKLAPGALPLDVACLSAGPPQALPGSDVVTANVPCIGPANAHRGRPSTEPRSFGLIVQLEQMGTLHAVPVALGDVI